MGEYWRLLNQSAQLISRGDVYGKCGEFLFNPASAQSIIKHLQRWQNPFPNMEAVLELIERDRAKRIDHGIVQETDVESPSDARCRLLELPEDVLRIIFVQARGYEDLLSLSATCMTMLRLLAPKTAEVCRNFEEDLGPCHYWYRNWNGERIAILGEYFSYTAYVSFIKNNIRAAFEKRGIVDLDEEALEAIKKVDNVAPHEDVYDRVNLDKNGYERIVTRGVRYPEVRPEVIGRTGELRFLLDDSHFDFVKARFIKPDVLLELQRFEAENPEPKEENYHGGFWDYFVARKVWQGQVETLRDAWYTFLGAKDTHRYESDLAPPAAIDLSDDGETDKNFLYRLTEACSKPCDDNYCVVNLDTRECMRSACTCASSIRERRKGAIHGCICSHDEYHVLL